METLLINGNATYFKKITRSLNEGMFNLRRAQSARKTTGFHITYYLLKDGKIVTHREWRQMGNPSYVVAGSKKGCEGHWIRTIDLQ